MRCLLLITTIAMQSPVGFQRCEVDVDDVVFDPSQHRPSRWFGAPLEVVAMLGMANIALPA